MSNGGWKNLVRDTAGFRCEGRFPIAAYSEFMPPPRVAIKPSGAFEYEVPFSEGDPWGWRISASEQVQEIAHGLPLIARQILETMVSLTSGRSAHRIGHYHLKDNPCWPEALAGRSLPNERHVFLSSLALAKSQDDKGRVRWTLFGASSDGPARGFWRSFFTAPESEIPEQEALEKISKILAAVYDLPVDDFRDLSMAGFRILPTGTLREYPEWSDGPLPGWTRRFLLDGNDIAACKYLLTFTPFALLPAIVQEAYLSGALSLLPSPESMLFWASPLVRRLGNTLPFGDQVLLLQAIAPHEGRGIRVPQSGWLHHAKQGHPEHDSGLGALRNTVRRTHRWQRVLRDDDDSMFAREDHVHAALFSTHPDDVRLYGKPMARNAQIWSSSFDAVLHGPNAGTPEIELAIARMETGGSFGYRFFYPPMQVGPCTLFWHYPLIACWDGEKQTAQMVDCGLNGYFSAVNHGGAEKRIELWPRIEPGGEKPTASAKIHLCDTGAPLTFTQTATRAFELRYWKVIADLAEGRYLNKNSGDCVRDSVTQAHLRHSHSDLDPLAEHLLGYYRALAIRAKMAERVTVGDLPFRWRTDFSFPWMDGWLANQEGRRQERDLITIIPGRNRTEAVIMADHYDTAYMEDVYGDRPGIRGDGARLAAAGADDNHSATAALMLGARVFLGLSRRGKLDCDIWLVHLTGEEFPADCLGARALTQRIIEGTLRMRNADGSERDLSQTRIRGVYVLDMIAHNNDHAPDIFQIAPGSSAESLWLAEEAAASARAWAAGVAQWNRQPPRENRGRGRRSADSRVAPAIAQHLAPKGEVRLHNNPKSTLYNTDGQIFSDAGLPVVLFMENYDINRQGYHDTHDTMANIDLDYGAALAAITIEAVARTAAATRSDTK